MTKTETGANSARRRLAREVSDEEYRRAWANEEYQKVLRKVVNQYRNQLSELDLESCALLGLWKALRRHDESHPSGQKFTTSLWRWTNRVCLNVLQKEKRHRRRAELAASREAERRGREEVSQSATAATAFPVEDSPAEEIISNVPEGYRDILREHFLEGKSLAAIAAERGLGYDAVRDHLARSVEVCRFAARQAASR
jgi:RNA polymerase sigma factor (sigma-70 family)